LDVGQRDVADSLLLHQIEGTRGPLQARAEHQHTHAAEISKRRFTDRDEARES
jgi:hypothetical protein